MASVHAKNSLDALANLGTRAQERIHQTVNNTHIVLYGAFLDRVVTESVRPPLSAWHTQYFTTNHRHPRLSTTQTASTVSHATRPEHVSMLSCQKIQRYGNHKKKAKCFTAGTCIYKQVCKIQHSKPERGWSASQPPRDDPSYSHVGLCAVPCLKGQNWTTIPHLSLPPSCEGFF